MSSTEILREQNKGDSAVNGGSELIEPCWSVVSFEKCEASGLTYQEAISKIDELDSSRIPGLCIVTDETAAKISG